ncbi:MAG: Asp-tRNA(Asn)/Glu-tRNA(Gln) amidotransferase subunit GatA [Elusimicrobia bacterium]|nr:Asp-tRNA(Asn)/Glu-tRNA(Gln) amidotransferase subunit GatA [Elusimicrobiota bacterium]
MKGQIKEKIAGCIGKIKQADIKIHSFLEIFEHRAIEKAEQLDEKVKNGDKQGRLFGLPVAIKDNIVIKGERATCGSKILEGFISPYDAEVVKRLEREDAVIIGRTNMDEFAFGSSTETSAWGVTRNPVNPEFVPGGSSGGSAASVAAGFVPVALGSDTGGSIRQPASFCGVCGFKPSYGAVSRYGLVAFGSSLDQIGPFAGNVRDIKKIFEVIRGRDEKDETSVEFEPVYALKEKVVCGIPKEYLNCSEKVKSAVKKTIEQLPKNFEVVEISLPHTEYAVGVYYIIAPSEASSNLARFDGIRYGRRIDGSDLIDGYFKTRGSGFGDEVKRRIMLGTFALSSGYYDAYYLKAQKVRAVIKRDFDIAFKKVDLIIGPTSPVIAFKIGEITDPLSMYLQDIFTIPANLAGIPAISIPCGRGEMGLPVGFQIMAARFNDGFLLEAAEKIEEAISYE